MIKKIIIGGLLIVAITSGIVLGYHQFFKNNDQNTQDETETNSFNYNGPDYKFEIDKWFVSDGYLYYNFFYQWPSDNPPKVIDTNIQDYDPRDIADIKHGGDGYDFLHLSVGLYDEATRKAYPAEYSYGSNWIKAASDSVIAFRYIGDKNPNGWVLRNWRDEKWTDSNNSNGAKLGVRIPAAALLKIGAEGDSLMNDVENPYTINEILELAQVTAFDDYYGPLPVQMIEDNYTANRNNLGVFELIFEASNPIGMTVEYTLKIINRDLVAPIISGPNNVVFSVHDRFDPYEYLHKTFTVYDSYDSEPFLDIESDDISQGVVGEYKVVIVAEDSSGNRSIFEYKLNLINGPIFYVSHSVIYLSTKTPLTTLQLVRAIADYEEITLDSYSVLENEYLGKEDKNGQYKFSVLITDEKGVKSQHERTLSVAELVYKPTIGDNINDWFEQTWKGITTHFSNYKNYYFIGLAAIVALSTIGIVIKNKK